MKILTEINTKTNQNILFEINTKTNQNILFGTILNAILNYYCLL